MLTINLTCKGEKITYPVALGSADGTQSGSTARKLALALGADTLAPIDFSLVAVAGLALQDLVRIGRRGQGQAGEEEGKDGSELHLGKIGFGENVESYELEKLLEVIENA